MGIISIGAKLIRNTKLGTVITETVGDKIFTNFYKKGGQLAKQRVKQIVRTNVGDKSVIAIKKVEKGASNVNIYQRDKVYGKNGKILGARHIQKCDNEKFVTKFANGIEQEKHFEDGIVQRRYYTNHNAGSADNPLSTETGYNNLGLPVPYRHTNFGLDGTFKGKTLKQMRQWSANRDEEYALPYSGLNFLNKKVDEFAYLPKIDERLNNLDKYL